TNSDFPVKGFPHHNSVLAEVLSQSLFIYPLNCSVVYIKLANGSGRKTKHTFVRVGESAVFCVGAIGRLIHILGSD
ncbi:MAG: hypothetical protein AAF443_08780, partial [Chlamydiota bacterium]